MLKCTYIVLLNNNEENIPYLVSSLKKLFGNFKKEFIIIDDGSKDNSLNILKSAVKDLPKTTIITQETQGPVVSINKAASLASGNYIHFIEGDEVLHPKATNILINACVDLKTLIACGKLAKITKIEELKDIIKINQKLISNPIEEILLNKNSPTRNIGSSGTLIHRDLFEKIGGADNSIYSQKMSLSLRCAKYTNFAMVNNIISYKRNNLSKDLLFDSYNNLRAIYNFANDNRSIFQTMTSELLVALRLETLSKRSKIAYFLDSMKAKYTKQIKLDTVLELYKTEFEKIF